MTDSWEIRYLRHVERETGKSLSAIAKAAGLSSTTLTRPVNDPDHKFAVKHTTLDAVEQATGISYAGFQASDEPLPSRVENGAPAPNGNALVPVYDVTASAGYGYLNEYEPQTHSLAFPPDYLRRLTSSSPKNLAIISVKGDSMEPTLLDGDVVMVDMSKTHLGYDGLFVLRVNDILHVKRIGLSARRGRVRIISDNKALYEPTEAEISEVDVVGKVLWYGRKV